MNRLSEIKLQYYQNQLQIMILDFEGTLLETCNSITDLSKYIGKKIGDIEPVIDSFVGSYISEDLEQSAEIRGISMQIFGEQKMLDIEFSPLDYKSDKRILLTVKDLTSQYKTIHGLLQNRNESILNKEVIEKQSEIIAQKNKNITSSINYAKRIQNAMLPTNDELETIFSEFFIFYQPRDIVSGDFYWADHTNEKSVIAVADCTGHGVPGAFMSMLGISLLNEIISKNNIWSPNEILNKLSEEVIHALKQSDSGNSTNDGMDISLCVIDKQKKTLEFAGAFNHLYLIRDGEMKILRGDKMPIGNFIVKKPFRKKQIEIREGDLFYMFTDGFPDQFGAENLSKYLVKNLKNLLLKVHAHPIQKQSELIRNEFFKWKGKTEQIDDITVMGFRVF